MAMTDTTAEGTIRTIRATVQSIETRLQRGNVPDDGLADPKAAIDDARLRLWAAISARSSAEPQAVLLRFRLRRATEICLSVVADLQAGTLGNHQRELLELREAVKELTNRLDASIRGTS
jgi:hypothetical protein